MRLREKRYISWSRTVCQEHVWDLFHLFHFWLPLFNLLCNKEAAHRRSVSLVCLSVGFWSVLANEEWDTQWKKNDGKRRERNQVVYSTRFLPLDHCKSAPHPIRSHSSYGVEPSYYYFLWVLLTVLWAFRLQAVTSPGTVSSHSLSPLLCKLPISLSLVALFEWATFFLIANA